MSDMILMDVLEAVDHLPKVKLGLLLVDLGVLHVLEKLSLRSQFHDHKNIMCGIQDLVQLYYIWMVDKFENPNFALNLHHRPLTFEIMFLFFIFFLLIIFTATSIPV